MTPSVIGYCALLRLTLLEKANDERDHTADVFLSAMEKELWVRCVTVKRRTEFLGGRIAAKMAANMYRAAQGFSPSAWPALAIHPQENGTPICQHGDGLQHPVSISHSHRFAVGLVSSNGRQAGADIEDDDSRVRPRADMFHEIELSQIHSPQIARLRWTIKEAWGKLTGQGIFGHTHDFITLKHMDRLWLSLPSERSPSRPGILAAGYWGPLAVSLGFDIDVEK